MAVPQWRDHGRWQPVGSAQPGDELVQRPPLSLGLSRGQRPPVDGLDRAVPLTPAAEAVEAIGEFVVKYRELHVRDALCETVARLGVELPGHLAVHDHNPIPAPGEVPERGAVGCVAAACGVVDARCASWGGGAVAPTAACSRWCGSCRVLAGVRSTS